VTPDFTSFYGGEGGAPYLDTVTDPTYSVSGPTFDIMQRGGLAYDGMGAPGGRPEIAPYPDWVAQYLVHENPATRAYLLRTADLAGSWPVQCQADERALVSIDLQPQFWLDARDYGLPRRAQGDLSAAATGPLGPDVAHQPSMAYVPYLITGDRYYADEMKFWANYDLLVSHPYYDRNGGQGILAGLQVRAFAWSLRDLVDAAAYLPDADPDKAYLVANSRTTWRGQMAMSPAPLRMRSGINPSMSCWEPRSSRPAASPRCRGI